MKQFRSFFFFAVLVGAPATRAQQSPSAETESNDADAASADPKAPPPPPAGVKTQGGTGFALSPDGAARLHVGLDAGMGFDTNPYSRPADAQPAEFNGDFVGRLRPSATVNYPGSVIAFDGMAMIDYGFLPGVIASQTQNFLLYQSLVSADLEVNRGGMLSLAVGDTFSWSNDPGNVIVGTVFNRINNQLRIGGGLRPGGGALQLRGGYTFDFTKYLDVQDRGGPIADGVMDSMQHGLQLRADYKFLPKTGFFAQGRAAWHSYPFSNVNPTSFPVSLQLGVQGQLLAKLAGLASVGYSNPLVLAKSGVDTLTVIGLIGQAELQWAPTPATSLGGGFQRSFAPAPMYQYLANNRFYMSFNQILAARFVIGLNAGYSVIQFGKEQPLNGSTFLTDQTSGSRLDGHLDGNAQVSYFVFDWMSVGIMNRTNWRLTNANDVTVPSLETNLGFLRNETFLLLSLKY